MAPLDPYLREGAAGVGMHNAQSKLNVPADSDHYTTKILASDSRAEASRNCDILPYSYGVGTRGRSPYQPLGMHNVVMEGKLQSTA